MSKIVALMGGGDWADASVEHLVIPDALDIEQEKVAWDRWYYDICFPSPDVEYVSFADWLKQRGARDTTDDELFEFWDT